jgi:hypothetical protein
MLIPLGILAQGGIELQYYLAAYGGTTDDFDASSGYDNLQNFYLGGYVQASPFGFSIVKLDETQSTQWQRSWFGASATGLVLESRQNVIAATSDGSAIYSAIADPVSGSGRRPTLTKFDSSGSAVWTRRISGTTNAIVDRVMVSPTGDVYIMSRTPGLLFKFDSSGSLVWRLDIPTGAPSRTALAIDPAGNVYVGSNAAAGLGGNDLCVIKIDSSGSVVWQRAFGTANDDFLTGVAVDSSGNVYVTGLTPSLGQIIKFNSSGTFQWQQELGAGNLVAVAADDTGAYALGQDYLIKYDNGGNIQYQRTINIIGNSGSVQIDSFGRVVITARITGVGAGGAELFSAVLPANGGLTGSYTFAGGTVTYGFGSRTSSSVTSTAITSSLTISTSSTAFTSPSATVSTPTHTVNTLSI